MEIPETIQQKLNAIRFSLFLLGISLMIRYVSFRNKAVKARLNMKDRTVGIRTTDQKAARTFSFKNGKIKSSGRVLPQTDAALIWSDAGLAFSAMASGYDGNIFRAFQQGNALIEGDAEDIFWFFSTLREVKDFFTAG